MKILLLILFSFTVEIFSQTGQSWQVVGDMPYHLYGSQAIVSGNKIYILGGYSDSLNKSVDLIQEFDPQTNSWSVAGHMQYPRSNFIADNFSDSVVYFGGLKTIDPLTYDPGTMEVWNFKSSPYVYKQDSNFVRSYATGHVVNGDVYTFGGLSGTNSDNYHNYLFEYNIDSEKVDYGFNGDTLFGSHIPQQQMSAVIGNDIYIFGGVGGGEDGTLINGIFDFNTVTRTLKLISGELDAVRAGGAAVSTQDSVIYLIGGYDELHSALSSVSRVDLKQSEIGFQYAPKLNYARKDPTAVYYNNSIYVFGGTYRDTYGNWSVVTQVEKLDLTTTGIQSQNTNLPNGFELENNYPNPFNPSTQIAFKVGKTARVSLDVYSILGQHVRTIVSREFSPGEYNFTWDGRDDFGNYLASGVYIYKLSSEYFTDSKKMLLLK